MKTAFLYSLVISKLALHGGYLFMTFLKNVCQWGMNLTPSPSGSEYKINPFPGPKMISIPPKCSWISPPLTPRPLPLASIKWLLPLNVGGFKIHIQSYKLDMIYLLTIALIQDSFYDIFISTLSHFNHYCIIINLILICTNLLLLYSKICYI